MAVRFGPEPKRKRSRASLAWLGEINVSTAYAVRPMWSVAEIAETARMEREDAAE